MLTTSQQQDVHTLMRISSIRVSLVLVAGHYHIVQIVLAFNCYDHVCVCVIAAGVKSSEEFAFVTEEDLSKRRRVRASPPVVLCIKLQFAIVQLNQ